MLLKAEKQLLHNKQMQIFVARTVSITYLQIQFLKLLNYALINPINVFSYNNCHFTSIHSPFPARDLIFIITF